MENSVLNRFSQAAVWAALMLCAAIPGAAQQRLCASDTLTVAQCLNVSRMEAEVPDKAQAAKAGTAGKPAGEANLGSLTPTIDDFLPRLSAALIAPGLDTTVAARLATNQSLNTELTGYVPLTLRLAAELQRPTVFQPILDSIAETRRQSVRDRFGKEFSEIDAIEFTAGFNVESRSRGRSYESHRDELELVVGNSHDAIEATFQALIGRLDASLVKNEPSCLPVPSNLARVKLGCLTTEGRVIIEKAITDLANAIGAFSTGYQNWAERTGWKYVPDLLNNQPQLSIQGTWRPRPNDAVGPESWSIRGRWERGWINLNAVRAFCMRRPSSPGYVNGRFDPTCFSDYLASERTQRLLRMGLRAFVQAEVTRAHKYDAPFIETDSAKFHLEDTWILAASAGLGGYLPTGTSTQGSRFDVGAELQWAERDDPLRPARKTLLSLSLTQRLNQNFSLLSGIVWSNRDDFGDRNVQRVRLNLGVRYKLVPNTPEAAK